MSQIVSVDNISNDDKKLEEKAEQLVKPFKVTRHSAFNMRQVGVKVTLGSKEPATADPQVVDSSVRALLVKKMAERELSEWTMGRMCEQAKIKEMGLLYLR